MKETDDFDQVLNDALLQYREAEPLSGIEGRVLRRLRMQAERRRKLFWRCIAVPALALLAALLWIGIRQVSLRPASPSLTQRTTPAVPPPSTSDDIRTATGSVRPEPLPAKAQSRSRHSQRTRTVAFATGRSTMPVQFPVATPLDSEELALLALARNNREALQPLLREDSGDEIAPINIQPLVVKDGGDEGEMQ